MGRDALPHEFLTVGVIASHLRSALKDESLRHFPDYCTVQFFNNWEPRALRPLSQESIQGDHASSRFQRHPSRLRKEGSRAHYRAGVDLPLTCRSDEETASESESVLKDPNIAKHHEAVDIVQLQSDRPLERALGIARMLGG